MQTSIHSCAKSHNLIYKLDVSLLIIQVYNIIPYFNSFTTLTNICRYYLIGRDIIRQKIVTKFNKIIK